MAYCLRSLVKILEQVMHPDKHYKNWVLDPVKIPQIQSLLEYATFLRNFFDTTSPLILHTMESLEDQIMEAAGKAEDAIESHITDQILSNPEGQSFMISPPDLGEVLRVFEVTKQEAINVKAAGQQWGDVSHPVSSTCYPDSINMVVGVTEDLTQLRSQLSARACELKTIPIVGMGGSGKSTLARILYDEHSSGRSSHFDCCAWVTVSQAYDPNQILQTLIDLIAKPLNGKPQQENEGSIGTLHKTLFGRRYLIVLDDIWSCKAWDDFQRAFPQDNNRSRIILTTRENTVANYVNSNSHQMHFLNEYDSWTLLSGKVFGKNSCPPDLEEVGKRIALNCAGLPLALQVIGGLLSQSEKSKYFWEYVAYNVSSMIATTDDRFSKIFSWSFINLPHYLKPCFLYMGAFPEDHAIRASSITKMWVAEGFLYPVPNKSLEEAVEIHLSALVDRNLIFVRNRKPNGKVRSYGIHDLLRDLCMRKAKDKKFIYIKNSKTDILQEDSLCLRRVIIELSGGKKDDFGSLKLTSLVRSFQVIGKFRESESDRLVSRMCFQSSLLHVLDAYPLTISKFHKEFLLLVSLRYISLFNPTCIVPRSISVLRNLQTLLVNSLESIMIIEDLPHLRHLSFENLEHRSYERSFSVHKNLQSISFVPLETLIRLLGKLPKLKKLGTNGSESNENVDLTCFQELESLNFRYGYQPARNKFPVKTIFACSIKNMTLAHYKITQLLLDTIGVLPNLHTLKLVYIGFERLTWEPSEDGFCQLRYLKFDNVRLENWLATDIHFPVLEHLVFNNCRFLTEISIDIGGIETLEIIEIDNCKTSLIESAKTILDEQSQFGNTLLQLRLGCALEEDKEGEEEEIKAMVQNNALRLICYTFRSTTILPRFLKRLLLMDCKLSQTSLHAVGILPELESLKVYVCDFDNSIWEPSEGEFCKLQYLKIRCPTLKIWLATEIHFPVLRRLVLKNCFCLDEIPHRIGGIETLEILDVRECCFPLFDSARRIFKEQCQLGNTLLKLRFGDSVEVYGENDDEEAEEENKDEEDGEEKYEEAEEENKDEEAEEENKDEEDREETDEEEEEENKDEEDVKEEEESQLSLKPNTWSWQSYIDDHLMADVDGNHLTASAILGHDGGVWAQSANFPHLKTDELNGIMTDFNEPGALASHGLYIGGVKYIVIQGQAGAVIRGKKGLGGATIKKTNMALIIGLYDEWAHVWQCNKVVEEIGDYLIAQGL